MQVSDEGLAFIREWEKFEPHPYKCSAGKDTIGYGHVMRYGEVFEVPMTLEDAEALLRKDVQSFATGVQRLIVREPEQHEFDAMVAFAFNVGIGAFSTSTLRRHFNAGSIPEAANEFRKWVWATKPDGVRVRLPGLVRRREAERHLFLGKPWRND